MLYLELDENDIVLSFDELPIDPIATKKAAMKAALDDDVVKNDFVDYRKILKLSSNSKNKNKYNKQLFDIRYKIKENIQSHMASNIVYMNNCSNSNIVHIDKRLEFVFDFVKNKPKNSVVVFRNGSLLYVDDYRGKKYFKNTDGVWSDYTIINIECLPCENDILHSELTVEQLLEIKLQSETQEQKDKRLKSKAYRAFIYRLFKESPEFAELGK